MIHYQKQTGIAILAVIILSASIFLGAKQHPTIQPKQASVKQTQTAASPVKGNIAAINNTGQSAHKFRPTAAKLTTQAALSGNQSAIIPLHRGKLTAYLATQAKGVIGLFDGNKTDNPADNIFSVTLDCQPTAHDKVWLTYRLTGVSDHSGVACSVNDRLAFGGYLVKKDTATTRQRIALNALWLQKGTNRFQFGLQDNAGYGYRISDLALEIEQGTEDRPLVVESAHQLYNGKAYVHGFVQGQESTAHIAIDGREVPVHDGEFEAIVTPNGQEVEVKAIVADRELTRSIHFDTTINADKEYALTPTQTPATRLFEKGKINELKTADVLLKTGNNTLIANKLITLTSLRQVDMPALDLGMTNVTADNKGFRFLPHGEHFTQTGATVALKYDRTKIPDGYTENDIKTFYFDNSTNHWVALARDTVDKVLCMVVSKTTHFTDMINGVIKTPESPETQGFAPTMMNDIKAADPTSKIELIAPPTANNSGSANLSYSLEMPPARNGMSPQLAISYNSDGGSGWLGEGWDLNVPTISVDTKWGVPRYDPKVESETYNLNGTMLATMANDSTTSDTISASVAHRGKMYKRMNDSTFENGQIFFPCTESNFNKIIRKGISPSSYIWEVYDKSGAFSVYGGNSYDDDSTRNATPSYTILSNNVKSFLYNSDYQKKTWTTSDKPDIAEWKLTKVKDISGLTFRYYYSKIKPQVGGITASSIYLDSITVGQGQTKYNDAHIGVVKDTVYYTIQFISNRPKNKQTFSARYGFFTANNKLLDAVNIYHNHQKLRGYRFVYKEGAFGIDLLDSIVQLDSAGNFVAAHTLHYNNTVSNNYNALYSEAGSKDVTQTGSNGLPALGGSISSTNGSSLYAGAGISFCGIGLEAGYNHGSSSSNSEKKVTLVDLNGDGLPDKVYTMNDGIYFLPNLGDRFGEAIKVTNAINQFSLSETKTTSNGWSGEAGVSISSVKAGVNAGQDWSETLTNTRTYFADVNNDGLVDIVCNGIVYFNSVYIDSNNVAIPSFNENSHLTLNPIQYNQCTVVGESATINSPAALMRAPKLVSDERKRLYNACPMQDVVRVWEAQRTGNVRIITNCSLQTGDEDIADGVTVSIQYKSDTIWHRRMLPGNENKDPLPLHVNKGDKLYFRVQAVSGINEADSIKQYSNAFGDVVTWEPEIDYTDYDLTQSDENGLSIYAYKSSDAYFVSKLGYNVIDSGQPVRLTGKLTLPTIRQLNGDTLKLRIYLSTDSLLTKDSIAYVTEHDSLFNSDLQKRIVYKVRYKNPNYCPKKKIYDFLVKKIDGQYLYSNNTKPTTNFYKSTGQTYLVYYRWNQENKIPVPYFQDLSDYAAIYDNIDDSNILDQIDYCRDNQIAYWFKNETTVTPNVLASSSVSFDSLTYIPGCKNYYWFEVSSNVNEQWDSITWTPELHLTTKQYSDSTVLMGVKYNTFAKKLMSGDSYNAKLRNRSDLELEENTLIDPCTTATINFSYNIKFSSTTGYVKNTNSSYTLLLINGNGDIVCRNKGAFIDSISGNITPYFTSKNADYFSSLKPILYVNDTICSQYLNNINANFSITRTNHYYYRHSVLIGGDVIKEFYWYIDYTNNANQMDIYSLRSEREQNMGPMYRGWGLFEYNAVGDRWNLPIKESELTMQTDTSSMENDSDKVSKITLIKIEPKPNDFTLWQGADEMILVNKGIMTPGRINIRYLSAANTNNSSSGSSSRSNVAPLTDLLISNFSAPKSVMCSSPFVVTNSDGTSTVKTVKAITNINYLPYFISNSELQEKSSYKTYSSRLNSRAFNVNEDTSYCINNAPVISSTFKSKTTYGGASASIGGIGPNISASKSNGAGYTTSNFVDLNGDGYPDRITEEQIEYSNARGGRDDEKCDVNGDPEQTSSSSWSLGFTGSCSQTYSDPDITKIAASISSKLSQEKSDVSFSLGASVHNNIDQSTFTYIDINGDGLPDKLQQDGNSIKVCYNLGYSFSSAVKWADLTIRKSVSKGIAVSESGGGSLPGLSFGAGANCAQTTTYTLYSLTDINGDGLVDQVYSDPDNSQIIVYLNMGNTMSRTPIYIKGSSYFDRARSFASSMNVNFKITIPILIFKISLGGSYSIGSSYDYTLNELQDINGDGYPDLLQASGDNGSTISYRLSNIGSTNKLISVTNPMGGSFSLHYKRSEASFSHPGGKWVMDSVVVNNGIDDGPNITTAFDYQGGYYDRREHEFLGFGTVVTKSIDSSPTGGNAVYRKVAQTYDVATPYVKGNLLSSTIYNAANKKYSENSNSYHTFNVLLWSRKDKYSGYLHLDSVSPITRENMLTKQYIIYSPVKYTNSKMYDDAGNGLVTSETFSDYYTGSLKGNDTCSHGELKSFLFSDKGNLGSEGTGSYNYKTSIEYVHTLFSDWYVYGLPSHVTVTGFKRQKYRETRAVWDIVQKDKPIYYPTFKILSIKQYLSDNNSDTTSCFFAYDRWGNLTDKYLPANANGQRMSYKIEYDPKYHTFPVKVIDAFGYSSILDNYNFKYGVPCKTIDENGNVMLTKLDNLGRVTSITGPNEYDINNNNAYTLKFDYHPQITKSGSAITAPAYATTKHYDPANTVINNFIETVTFVDGFGRAVQVKKDGVIGTDKVMIVSGRAKYDAFGRVKAAYYPIAETDAGKKYLFNAAFDSTLSHLPSTRTAYDVVDRPLITRLPDGTATQMSYAIDKGLLKTTVTDALNHSQESFANGSGQTVKTVQHLGNDTIVTSFYYDDINQLDSVVDAMKKKTVSVYDMAGRRTQVTHPASGVTKFEYDAASNLLSKQTANMLKGGGSKKIQYYYTYHRLDSICYPDHKENNVKYVYGTKDEMGDPHNNWAGRLKYQEDGSGAQLFKYGKQGELTEVRRTLVIPNQAVATYVTGWKYDCWNRLQTMTYPDGEVLSYKYNLGGLLWQVQGTKSGATYNYVDSIKYDKFEQRTRLRYGNGAVTCYAYNDSTRHLQNLGVLSTKINKQIMNNAYKFDRVGNILSVTNNAVTANNMGGVMVHNYEYDNLYRLKSANGTFTGANGKTAKYALAMGYDALYNVVSKKQDIEQFGVQFKGTLKAGYDLNYTIADNGQQIANIAEESYRTDSTLAKVPEKKVSGFSYDANGNLLCINTGTKKGDKLLATNSRKLLWDEENRLLASSDNGFVTSYYYDLSGERTVKMSGDDEGININGQTSGLRAGITNFTAYINPYLNVRKGGEYTKHIYIGGQRITSKVGNSGLFNAETNPLTLEKANKVNFTDKQNALTATIKDRYDSLGVAYKGALQSGGLTSKLPSDSTSSYFYHSDHLGSSSLITDANGEIVQHVEYVPYGDTFIDERRSQSSWHTPFLFSGKERDEETGLLYVSQRYQDGKYCIWYSVDPLALKYPNISSYVYCHNNPVNLIDPTGKGDHKPDTYTLPKNPNQIDTKTWEPIKPQNIPEGKGHALYWKNKDSNVYLAWDKEDHYHLYTNERFKTRLDANGNLVKAKGVTSAHLEPGTVINLSNAIKTSVSVLNFAFSLSSILTDSPQNPLYIFQAKGSGKQNRAYLDTETNQIYEWSFVPGTKVREVRFYEAYDYINKQWRGVGYKNSQYFEEKGKETYIR